MSEENILTNVKLNLGIAGDVWDNYLRNLIKVSKSAITTEGINLTGSIDDSNLVVMYTAYLYRKRAEDVAPMPRMLRYALNNRLFAEKGGRDDF